MKANKTFLDYLLFKRFWKKEDSPPYEIVKTPVEAINRGNGISDFIERGEPIPSRILEQHPTENNDFYYNVSAFSGTSTYWSFPVNTNTVFVPGKTIEIKPVSVKEVIKEEEEELLVAVDI